MKLFTVLLTLLAISTAAFAGDAPPPPAPALLARASKIVAPLALPDAAQAARLTEFIARHYAQLSLIHGLRDNSVELARSEPDKQRGEQVRQTALNVAAGRLAERHFAFVARLTAELTPAQVEQIKDGMTYGVAPNTFRVYQQMLPNLTTEQRMQIHAWLLEAREHAMQAGSAEEKHGWFGKYKGRINNYLSQAGIDMKAAEKNLQK